MRYKLFLVYATVYIGICSLSFALLYSQVRDNIEHYIKEELSTSNQAITDMVETAATASIKSHLRAIAEKNREILTLFYEESKKTQITESQAKERAARILFSQVIGETGYIYCINSQGMAVVHPKREIHKTDLSRWDFIQEQIRKKEGYLEYDWKNPEEVQPRSKALYMTYFEPWDWIISVSSYKSEFAKLVSIDDFKNQILGLTYRESGYSYVIDTKGNWVIHPEMSGNIFDTYSPQRDAFLKEMISQRSGYLTYFWKNPSEPRAREKFIAFDFIPNFNWIIASSSYTEEVFSPLLNMRKIFILIAVLTLLITAVVSLAVSASITKPLTAFIRRFEKAAEGDLTSRMDDARQDEIGKISASFNLFMDRLDTAQKETRAEITNRKKAQEELDNLQHYLSDIINSMPSILIGVDRHLHVTQWNKKAQEETGLSMSDATGKYILDVFPRIEDQISQIRESLTTNETRQISKLSSISDTGDTRHEDVTIYPLSHSRDRGAVLRIDDVTEKEMLEEAIVQNEKMLSVGGLAAGMAHEINNPLAGVIQNSHLLINRLTDTKMPANIKAAEEAATTMEIIHDFMTRRKIPRIIGAVIDSSTRMADIVENMLSFARKEEPTSSTHDLVTLMDKTLTIASSDYDLRKHYDFKSIIIEKEYEPDLPMIGCQGNKIQQVILNILNNGAQAMTETPGNKKPKFILRLFREIKANMLCMEIQDNGPGMDPKIRKRIFEPFFTTKPVGIGTGLGLSVSYFIITENHGGTLDVVSKPGKGTTFIIRLPMTTSPDTHEKQ